MTTPPPPPIIRPPLRELAGRVPHLAWPLRVEGGRLVTVEQDSPADVRGCVHLLMRTPRGARPLAPEVGMDDPTFSRGLDAEAVAAELAAQEPRARVEITTTGPDAAGRERVRVLVDLIDAEEGERA